MAEVKKNATKKVGSDTVKKAPAPKTEKKVATKATPETKVKKVAGATPAKTSIKKEEVIKSAPKAVTKKSVDKPALDSSKKYITIKQVKSAAGRIQNQHKTLTGLALGKVNKVSQLEDTPAVRGMINKVKHLVQVI